MTDYARHEHHDFLGATEQALVDEPLQAALIRLTGTLMAGNRRSFAASQKFVAVDVSKRPIVIALIFRSSTVHGA